MFNRRQVLTMAGATTAATLTKTSARAQTRMAKKIDLYVGYTPGGSYDLYARMIARHLGRFLPGEPTVVPQNMPGAGSLRAANYIYSVAPKDGSAMGVVSELLGVEQALDDPAVQYDAAKFTWIGRAATSNNIQMAWHTSKVQSVEDAMQTEASVAGTGPGNIAERLPRLMNVVLGTKFKIVSGYRAAGDGMLAMERGEVDIATTSWAAIKSTKQDWLREKKIKIILQDVPERDPELPDVPCLGELGNTPEQKQLLSLYATGGAIGRALMAPPGLPAEIAKVCRDGFAAMTKDPEFLADMQKASLEVEPLSGEQLQKVVVDSLQIPQSVRERAKAAFGGK